MAVWLLDHGSRDWTPDAEWEFAYWRRSGSAYTRGLGYDDAKAAPLIDAAWEGDVAAEMALRCFASERIEAGEPLPPNLQKFVVDLLDGKEPSQRLGRPLQHSYARDLHIAVAVSQVVFLGFQPTRNRASERPSACSIVAAALADIRYAIGERRVEAIWAASPLKDEPPLEPLQFLVDPKGAGFLAFVTIDDKF